MTGFLRLKSQKNETIENEINENSLITKEAFVEPYLSNAKDGQQYQFQRLGYFVKTDNKKTLEFNKTVGLRDGWKSKNYSPQTHQTQVYQALQAY